MVWSRRYGLLGSLFCAFLLCYLDRMAMATAIPFIAQDFHLSSVAMGSVLSAFFVGYAIMQIPGGLLTDRFGPRPVIIVSMVLWSIFTAMTGTATSLASMLAIRVVFGLCEGPFPPSASKAITISFPTCELGRANGIQLAAVNIGAAVAPIVVASLIVNWGWRVVFYSLLPPGLLLALVIGFAFSGAGSRFNAEDRQGNGADEKIRLNQLLQSPALLWCSLTLFLANIATWGLLNWLPTYLLQARGFGTAKMGMLAPLPYIAGAIGYYAGGHLSDRYFANRRQIPVLLGLILAGGMTCIAALAPSGEWAIAALVPGFLCLFVASAGLFTLPLVISPPAAVGGAFGIVNTVGQTAAFLSPLLVGYVLDVTNRNFTVVFYGLVCLCVASAGTASRIRQPADATLRNQSSADGVLVRR